MTTPVRFSGPGKVRAAGLRRDREVFEGEEPFEVIAHAAVAEDQAPDAFQSSAPETATVIVGVTHNAAISTKANPGRCGLSSRRFLLISA